MPAVPHPDPREAVMQIVTDLSGAARKTLTDDTRIVEDLGLDGDDVDEIVEEVATTFGTDVTAYRWDHHHGGEGAHWLPFWPWRTRRPWIPIRIGDLITAARTGVWPIEYPD